MTFADVEIAKRHAVFQAELALQIGKAAERVSTKYSPAFATFGGIPVTFCGDGSPLTQVNVTAPDQDLTEAIFAQIDDFYEGRASNFELNIGPFASPQIWEICAQRGWFVVNHENLLFLTKENLVPGASVVSEIENLGSAASDDYIRTITEGFFGPDAVDDSDISEILKRIEGSQHFLAKFEGERAGAGSLLVWQGTGFLGGMATRSAFRGRGVQQSLIQARVNVAFEQGCDLVLVTTQPGSGSQRNMERAGFRVAYTRSQLGRGQ